MLDIQIEERMTEAQRHDKIMEFVKLNPKRTKAQVMRFMKDNHVSEPTTFKDITYLIEKKRLLMLKNKPNSQTHYLIVNEEDEFNIISEQLSGIENLIQAMDEPTRKYTSQYWSKNHSTFQKKPEGILIYFWGYQAQIIQFLRILLVRTSELSLPEKYSQILYTRIVKSMIKVDLQFWRRGQDLIQMTEHFHYENEPTPALKKLGIDDKLVYNLVTVIVNFKKRYSKWRLAVS